MPILNYTTSISADKTVGEIQKLLAEHGASRIAVDYENGRPSGITFGLVTPHGPRGFALPVDIGAMHGLLKKEDDAGRLRSGTRAIRSSREQAERVAWRVLKDWVAAQMTMVQSQMASMDQVMLPYLQTDGRTLYAAYVESENLALAASPGSR